MSWLTGYEFRRWFKFKIKDNPLILVNKGCPESCRCKDGYLVESSGELYLHGKAESFPDDIVFTSDDGITILKQHLDFEQFYEKGKKGKKHWDRLWVWVKFVVDRPWGRKRRKTLTGYIYYGKLKARGSLRYPDMGSSQPRRVGDKSKERR